MELNYEFELEDFQIADSAETYNIDYYVNENDLKLILAFLFEKKFNVPYRELGWWLEPGAEEWAKDTENLWLKNKLDLYPYKDEYYKFLYKYFISDASEEALELYKDDWEMHRDWMLDDDCDTDNDDYIDDDIEFDSTNIDIYLDGELIS